MCMRVCENVCTFGKDLTFLITPQNERESFFRARLSMYPLSLPNSSFSLESSSFKFLVGKKGKILPFMK